MLEHRLLIVDDDDAICELLQNIAETVGFAVKTALSVPDFKAQYNDFKPNIILLDLSIGDQDGIELLRYLTDHACNSFIIMMSGHDEKVISTAFRLGREYGLNIIEKFQKPIDMRWQPKDYSLILPEDFIPMLEDLNLIDSLTEWVIEKAFSELVEWTKNNLKLSMHINLSVKLLNKLSFPDQMVNLAKKYKLEPKDICFEITESGAMSGSSIVTDILIRLRIKGFNLSLDDFGVGYSSLVELYRLPFSEIKIDKSFITNVLNDKESLTTVNSIIQLGHNLNMEVVAEGIENKEVWEKLASLGCDMAQGFYMGRPMTAENFNDWIKYALEGNKKYILK